MNSKKTTLYALILIFGLICGTSVGVLANDEIDEEYPCGTCDTQWGINFCNTVYPGGGCNFNTGGPCSTQQCS